jgi:hypothetical protein
MVWSSLGCREGLRRRRRRRWWRGMRRRGREREEKEEEEERWTRVTGRACFACARLYQPSVGMERLFSSTFTIFSRVLRA